MKLHDYQLEHIRQVLEVFETERSVMLQMPTGTGKTHVFCEIAKHFYKKGKERVLILAHRTELIKQIKDRISGFGINAGIIKSGYKIEEGQRVQIASVQTLCRRDKVLFLRNVSLIIVDEAHHTPSSTYVAILKTYQKEHTKLLGVTATPLRLDGKGFENIFDRLISSYSFKWFVENSYLSPIRHFASDIIKLENVSVIRSREGFKDYDEKQAEAYYLNKIIMADIIDSYIRFGENKKAIVFAVTIKHAKEISERYNDAGFNSCVISSFTSNHERQLSLEKFIKGEIQILVNVDIFSEGFDCPDIEVVQIVRPTKSLVKYLQMVGRVTRIFKGKKYAIILDNACLWQDHGLVSNDRSWTLNGCTSQEYNFSDLQFTDGSSGNDAYKRKLKELFNIDMIEVDKIGVEDSTAFTNRRLLSVRREYKVTWKQLTSNLNESNIDIFKHLQGISSDPDRKYVSEQLFNYIDRKYCSHKGIDNIQL